MIAAINVQKLSSIIFANITLTSLVAPGTPESQLYAGAG
jgi:hypothetical protein